MIWTAGRGAITGKEAIMVALTTTTRTLKAPGCRGTAACRPLARGRRVARHCGGGGTRRCEWRGCLAGRSPRWRRNSSSTRYYRLVIGMRGSPARCPAGPGGLQTLSFPAFMITCANRNQHDVVACENSLGGRQGGSRKWGSFQMFMMSDGRDKGGREGSGVQT